MNELTVHKNKLEQRKRKETRDLLIDDARKMARHSGISERISGYAIVAWDDDHRSQAAWVSGCLPSGLIGEQFKQTMARRLNELDRLKDSE